MDFRTDVRLVTLRENVPEHINRFSVIYDERSLPYFASSDATAFPLAKPFFLTILRTHN